MSSSQPDFEPWVALVRGTVNDRLQAFFSRKAAEVESLSPDSIELVEEVRDLTLRGGKRLRPAVMAAAYQACSGDESMGNIAEPGAALELMQSFFLIHDDWMDQDEQRRGGPSVHHSLAQKHGDAHIGASLSTLAGDLASTCAWELMLRAEFPASTKDLALRTFADIHTKVYLGQHLDITANNDVQRMHQLKTGSYTVDGPAMLGALLAEADTEKRDSLKRWAEPLGEAFQLRDDLLGTFGDFDATGKPGDDVRHGNRTAVITAFEEITAEEDRGPLSRALGNFEADEVVISDAVALLISSGAKGNVEKKLEVLTHASESALADTTLTDKGKTRLLSLTQALTHRSF